MLWNNAARKSFTTTANSHSSIQLLGMKIGTRVRELPIISCNLPLEVKALLLVDVCYARSFSCIIVYSATHSFGECLDRVHCTGKCSRPRCVMSTSTVFVKHPINDGTTYSLAPRSYTLFDCKESRL